MRLLLFLAMLIALTSPASASPIITDVNVIAVHDGINVVADFTADRREATIVRAWRDNGNAHGHYVYLVLLPLQSDTTGPDNKTGVVTIEDGKAGLADTLAVSPLDGERVLGTVRFARARIDGAPTVVVIRADLGEAQSGVLADHAPVEIKVYRLEHPGVDVGTTPDVFRLVSRLRPSGLFCNADMALATTMHLPLPPDYAGGRAPSGCSD